MEFNYVAFGFKFALLDFNKIVNNHVVVHDFAFSVIGNGVYNVNKFGVGNSEACFFFGFTNNRVKDVFAKFNKAAGD